MRMVDNMHVLATIRHIRYGVVTRESGRKKSGITSNKMWALGAPLKGYK